MQKAFTGLVEKAKSQNRVIVAPLVGFPGLNLTGCTVKLAQQNYGEHFKVIRSVVDTFGPDIVFPLMDLAVEANALGCYTIFPQEDSATVVRDRFDLSDLSRYERINIAFDTRLQGYVETMKLMSLGLPPGILRGAYVTGPYTLAALMLGADEAAMATILDADRLERICQFTTEKIHEYVRMLIAAGAQVICVLEPTAVMLGPETFERFSAKYVNFINNSCRYAGVATIYHTCGNTMHLIEKMAEAGVDAISLDAEEAGVDLPLVAEKVSGDVMVMGNLNPTGSILNGSPEMVEEEVNDLVNKMKQFPNFILSTGCDLPQETPVENIRAFIRTGRSELK